jgi:hypothetical protein
VELGGFDNLTEVNLTVHNMNVLNVNPLLHNFTSPISEYYPLASAMVFLTIPLDIAYASEAIASVRMKPKYTFKK